MRRLNATRFVGLAVVSALVGIVACDNEPPGEALDGPLLHEEPGGPGSHFRYATFSWGPTGTMDQIRFRLNAAFRRTAYSGTRCIGTCADGFPGVGDTIIEAQGATAIDFGDGTTTPVLQFQITAIDQSNADVNGHWVLGEALDPTNPGPGAGVLHTYDPSTTAPPYTASLVVGSNPACCRIGQTGFPTIGLNNRPGGSYPIQTVVNELNGNSSPTSSMVPILAVLEGSSVQFPVPAADANDDQLAYRLATAAEAGNGPAPLHPPGLSINPTTGTVTWDNVGLNQTDVWTTQVMIEDGFTKTPVDFLLRITGAQVGALPQCLFNPATDPISASIGEATTFQVVASDADGTPVTLNAVFLPPGASTTPTLVAGSVGQTADFDWTPDAGQEGTHVVQFTATDPDAQQTVCTVTIEVNIIDAAGGTIPVTDETGAIVGFVEFPPGAFPSNTVILATIDTDDPDCVPGGGIGDCLSITIPSGTTMDPSLLATVVLCLDPGVPLLPQYAIFREDDAAMTAVLQNVEVVDTGCPASGSSNFGTNPVTRLARSLWNKISAPFRPRVAYAWRAHLGPAGLTNDVGTFQWGEQLFVRAARLEEDGFRIRGSFHNFVGFDPATEAVTVIMGSGADQFSETIPAGSFATLEKDEEDAPADVQYLFRPRGAPGGIERMIIVGDGTFDVTVSRSDVSGVVDHLTDDGGRYVSFFVRIGDVLQGVGLTFDEMGKCTDANGSGDCQVGEGDEL